MYLTICARSVIRHQTDTIRPILSGACVAAAKQIFPSEMSPGKQTEHVSVTYYKGDRGST